MSHEKPKKVNAIGETSRPKYDQVLRGINTEHDIVPETDRLAAEMHFGEDVVERTLQIQYDPAASIQIEEADSKPARELKPGDIGYVETDPIEPGILGRDQK